jgi:hypothetical protein
MAKRETPDHESGLGDIDITVVVVPGRLQVILAKLRPSARVRVGLASVAVLAAVAAGAIIAVSSSSGGASRPLETDAMSTHTLTLHRSYGAWLREFETSNWACPAARLPHRVAIGLHFCGPNLAPLRALPSPSPRSR